MTQLELNLYPDVIAVNGLWDRNHEDIKYLGDAKRDNDGRWICLANVAGMLCIVEVKPTKEIP